MEIKKYCVRVAFDKYKCGQYIFLTDKEAEALGEEKVKLIKGQFTIDKADAPEEEVVEPISMEEEKEPESSMEENTSLEADTGTDEGHKSKKRKRK